MTRILAIAITTLALMGAAIAQPASAYGQPYYPIPDYYYSVPGYYVVPGYMIPPPPVYPYMYQAMCATWSSDGFVNVKTNPDPFSYIIQTLPNGVPLNFTWDGSVVDPWSRMQWVWVWTPDGSLQGWARIASLACH